MANPAQKRTTKRVFYCVNAAIRQPLVVRAGVGRERNQDAFARRYGINRSYLNMILRAEKDMRLALFRTRLVFGKSMPLNEALPAALGLRCGLYQWISSTDLKEGGSLITMPPLRGGERSIGSLR
jgi:hypothetical protein